MNKILIILSFVLLTSCGPKDVPYKNLVTRQGITYEVNSETPFTGSQVGYWKTVISSAFRGKGLNVRKIRIRKALIYHAPLFALKTKHS
jgi:hypothetical protein